MGRRDTKVITKRRAKINEWEIIFKGSFNSLWITCKPIGRGSQIEGKVVKPKFQEGIPSWHRRFLAIAIPQSRFRYANRSENQNKCQGVAWKNTIASRPPSQISKNYPVAIFSQGETCLTIGIKTT
jgi:hypothetical protein